MLIFHSFSKTRLDLTWGHHLVHGDKSILPVLVDRSIDRSNCLKKFLRIHSGTNRLAVIFQSLPNESRLTFAVSILWWQERSKKSEKTDTPGHPSKDKFEHPAR